MAIVLVCLKMSVEFLYKNNYSLDQVGTDKIFYLCDRLFDSSNIYCRFTFLEFSAKKKKMPNLVQKRLFGVSPMMQFFQAEDSRSRAIFAKNQEIDSWSDFIRYIHVVKENVLNIKRKRGFSTGEVDQQQKK